MEEGEGRDPLRNAGVYLTYSSLPLTVRLPRWTETAQRLSSTGGVPGRNAPYPKVSFAELCRREITSIEGASLASHLLQESVRRRRTPSTGLRSHGNGKSRRKTPTFKADLQPLPEGSHHFCHLQYQTPPMLHNAASRL